VWRKRNLPTPLVEYKLTRSVWKTVWRFLKRPKIELPYDPAISLLGIYLEKAINSKNIGFPIFITALFTTAKTWKQPKCPLTDEWIKKMWYIYTMEYYSAIKGNTFESVLMRWMNLEPILQSKVRKRKINIIY